MARLMRQLSGRRSILQIIRIYGHQRAASSSLLGDISPAIDPFDVAARDTAQQCKFTFERFDAISRFDEFKPQCVAAGADFVADLFQQCNKYCFRHKS
jgi:hypothetical protein